MWNDKSSLEQLPNIDSDNINVIKKKFKKGITLTSLMQMDESERKECFSKTRLTDDQVNEIEACLGNFVFERLFYI